MMDGRIVAGFGLLAAAITKFAHLPPVVAQLTNAGFRGDKIMLVAALELLSALLFVFPVTRSIGLVFASAFPDGAVATHVQAGKYAGAFAPALFILVCWLGAWLRHPELLWSINRHRQKE
jgi:DoxX-like family